MKVQIRLDTYTDVRDFVRITTALDGDIHITDNKGLRVNAKSLLGAMYSLEFEELWCESEFDIYRNIEDFIII